MKYCRLCGAGPLATTVADAALNQWYRCGGCGSDLSEAAYALKMPEGLPDRLECAPGPIRFLVELHAAVPVNSLVRLETVPLGTIRPGLLQVLSPAFLEATVRDLGFRVVSRPAAGADPQVWELQKTDGL